MAGGDTASALAAGNPVIAKAHPAHPGTSELVGHVIRESIFACELPDGTFSMLFDSGTNRPEKALVATQRLRLWGLQGPTLEDVRCLIWRWRGRSRFQSWRKWAARIQCLFFPGHFARAGLKSHQAYVLRPSRWARPVLHQPRAWSAVPEGGLDKLPHGSSNASRPGIVLHFLSRDFWDSRTHFRKATSRGTESLIVRSSRCSSQIPQLGGVSIRGGSATFSETDAGTFLTKPELGKEIFGPTTLVVKHATKKDLLEIVASLEGHLAAAVHGTAEDFEEFAEVIHLLEEKVGRIVCNGFPTGVEVSPAMVHGGSVSRNLRRRGFTSVGTGSSAIRKARLLQDCPPSLLPDELKDANPLQIMALCGRPNEALKRAFDLTQMMVKCF